MSILSLALMGCVDTQKADDTGPAVDDTSVVGSDDTSPGTDDTGGAHDDTGPVTAEEAVFTLYGNTDEQLGTTITAVPGEGFAYFVAAAPGSSTAEGYLVPGFYAGAEEVSVGLITGGAAGEELGLGLDLDENEGLVAGAPGTDASGLDGGRVYVIPFEGISPTGEQTLAEANATTLQYGTSGARAGASVAWVGNLPGGTKTTGLLVGAPGEGQGKAMLYFDASAVTTLDSPDWTVTLAGSLDAAAEGGHVVAHGGEVTGAATSVAVAAPGYATSAAAAAEGAVFVFDDLLTSGDESAATASFFGQDAGDAFGTSMVVGRDLDGDGVGDLAVGAPNHSGHGAVYVFFGPLTATGVSAADADVQITISSKGADLGAAVAFSGESEPFGLLVGAPGLNGAAGQAIEVTDFSSASVVLDAAAAAPPPTHGGSHWLGECKNDEFGGGLGGPGPVIIGAPGYNGGGGQGALYIY